MSIKGRPDPPTALRFVNSTHNSITLTWEAGFDGGAHQAFRVRYKEADGDGGYKYEDVVPSDATVFTVSVYYWLA